MWSGAWLVLVGIGTLSALLSWAMISISTRKGWVSQPRPDRWGERSVALMGGLGMGLTWVLCLLAWSAGWFPDWPILHRLLVVTLILYPGILVVVGFVDDLKPIDPRIKLYAQGFCALATLMALMSVLIKDRTSVQEFIVIGFGGLLTIGLCNAVNMLDNMDGLAAGTTSVSAVGIGLAASSMSLWSLAMISFALGAISLGFLIWNAPIFRPAKLFMGDCGSLMMGFLLGIFVVWLAIEGSLSGWMLLASPLLVLAPLSDTAFVIWRRLARKRPVFQGGKDHISHHLARAGLSPRAIFGVHLLVAALGVGGFWVGKSYQSTAVSAGLCAGFFVLWLLAGIWLKKFEEVEPKKRSKKR